MANSRVRNAEDSNDVEDSVVFLAFPSHGDFRQYLYEAMTNHVRVSECLAARLDLQRI